MTWYYVKGGEPAGPISDEELLSKLRLGAILPTTLVWRKGMGDWQPASAVSSEIVPPPAPVALSYEPGSLAAPPELASGPPPVLPNFFCTSCGNIIPADELVRIGGRTVCAACKPAYVQQVQEGIAAPVKVPVVGGTFAELPVSVEGQLADPAIRLVAHILDLLFIGLPVMFGSFLLFMIVGVTAAAISSQQSKSGGPAVGMAFGFSSLILMALTLAWVIFYWTWFIGRRGATPGMKIMKVKMVRGDRSAVSYGRALGRALVLYFVNAFTFSLTNLTAFFDPEKRTLVDMICDTRVVRT